MKIVFMPIAVVCAFCLNAFSQDFHGFSWNDSYQKIQDSSKNTKNDTVSDTQSKALSVSKQCLISSDTINGVYCPKVRYFFDNNNKLCKGEYTFPEISLADVDKFVEALSGKYGTTISSENTAIMTKMIWKGNNTSISLTVFSLEGKSNLFLIYENSNKGGL